MKVKVDMNLANLNKLSAAQIKAAKMTAEKMRAELILSQEMPFDTGNLQNVTTYVDTTKAKQGLIQIVHDAPYSTRLYYHPEYNFQTTFNKNARGEWWEEWLTGVKKTRPAKLFSEFYKRVMGGV